MRRMLRKILEDENKEYLCGTKSTSTKLSEIHSIPHLLIFYVVQKDTTNQNKMVNILAVNSVFALYNEKSMFSGCKSCSMTMCAI